MTHGAIRASPVITRRRNAARESRAGVRNTREACHERSSFPATALGPVRGDPGAPAANVPRNQLTLTVKSVDTLLVRASKTDLGTTFTKCSATVPCQGTSICSGNVCIAPGFPVPPANDVGVDNFTCYKVVIARGAPKFVPITGGRVQLTDEFGGPLAYDVLKPTHLCTPVDKENENPGAETHAGHLMCYQVKLSTAGVAKFVPHEVAAANTNFPNARLMAKSLAELCVPAEKDPLPGAN
jgi:hypothetical protein